MMLFFGATKLQNIRAKQMDSNKVYCSLIKEKIVFYLVEKEENELSWFDYYIANIK